MTPIWRLSDAAFDRLLPFYGIKTKRKRREAIAQGRIHALAQPLRSVEWSRLAARMGAYQPSGAMVEASPDVDLGGSGAPAQGEGSV